MKKILSSLVIVAASYMGMAQCTTMTAPFLETFQSNSVPACWTASGSTTWEYQSPTGGFAAYGASGVGEHTGTTGSWAIGMDGSDNSNGDISYLQLPDIDIAALPNPALIYWVFSNNTTQSCNNEVRVEVYDGTNWIVEESFAQDLGPAYVQRVVSLGAYTGVVQVRFVVSAMATSCGSAFYNDILFDDVSVVDCSPTFASMNAQGCQYYSLPSGKEIYETGTYTDTIANFVGCDSIITVNFVSNNTYATVTTTGTCGTYVLPNGEVIGADGIYYDTIPNTAMCDSVIMFDLSFSNSVASFSMSACNIYTAPSGATYTANGVYNDTIPNTVGCDSIMTIDVTVNYNDNVTIFATTCGDDYTSDAGIDYGVTGLYIENYQTIHGCDSILYIDVVINSGNNVTVDVTSCDEFVSDAGEVYTATGTYQESFLASTNCDSVITYNVIITSLDLTVSEANNILTANESGTGITYQWVDCNNGNAPLAGETNQTYATTVNGDYACILTSPDCTKMTACFRYEGLSVGDVTNIFNVYPNPSNGNFTIELTNVSADASYEVSNTAGQIVSSNTLTSNSTNVSLVNVEKGMYIITITNEGSKSRQAIVVE